jgi:hypothetical protein
VIIAKGPVVCSSFQDRVVSRLLPVEADGKAITVRRSETQRLELRYHLSVTVLRKRVGGEQLVIDIFFHIPQSA